MVSVLLHTHAIPDNLFKDSAVLLVAEARVATLQEARIQIINEQGDIAAKLKKARKSKKAKCVSGSKGMW
jgi:hypothetical protein